ncbi:glycosyltransferase [bacterium]|nr:glycosyltransferase [bacterium]
MPAPRWLRQDIEELLKRCQDVDLVARKNEQSGDLFSTALVVPTLAERGYINFAKHFAAQLIERRDHEGGWDDNWTTTVVLEAFVGLSLRGHPVPGSEQVILRAAEVLKGADAQDITDRELRVSRTIVLAGLALQNSQLIDAGLLRARSVIDSGWSPDDEISECLHGFLALTDINLLNKDSNLSALLYKEMHDSGLEDPDRIAQRESIEVLCRAGTVLEKVGKRNIAEKYYELACKSPASTLTTATLKFRIELGARLIGKHADAQSDFEDLEIAESPVSAESIEQSKVEEAENHNKDNILDDLPEIEASPEIPEAIQKAESIVERVEHESISAKSTSSDVPTPDILLPALRPVDKNIEISAVIIDNGVSTDLQDTLTALSRQVTKPGEVIVVLKASEEQPYISNPDLNIRFINPSPFDTNSKRWDLGGKLTSGKWIWFMPAGVKPQPLTLEKFVDQVLGRNEFIFLSNKKDELNELLKKSLIEPVIPPEKLLVNREKFLETGFNTELHGDPFWHFVLENVTFENSIEIHLTSERRVLGFDLNELHRMEMQLRDRYTIYKRLPLEDEKERADRLKALERARMITFNAFKQQGQPLVSIVIPHFNLPDLLIECVQSIVENTLDIPFEIIVIDNGSDNTSKELISKLEQWGVLFLRSDTNEGFAKACNRGARAARGQYVLLLNNDTKVRQGWLRQMVTASQEEDAGIVGARLLYPNGKVQHAGITISADKFPGHIYCGAPGDFQNVMKRRSFQAVTGACMLIRKELYERLGGMDEAFLNSFEDIDFCLKARTLGVNIVYEPSAVVTHHTESTPGRKDNDAANIELFMNRYENSIAPDLHLYAEMDGYRLEQRGDKEVMVPLQKTEKASHQREEADMETLTPTRIRNMKQPKVDEFASDEEKDHRREMLDLLARADLMIRDGNFTTAEQALVETRDSLNGNKGTNATYWTLLGDARFRLDRPEEAIECYHKAVADDPSAYRAWVGIGAYLLIKGQDEKAEEIFTKVADLDPQNSRGHMGLGNVELRRGNHDFAVDHFKKAATLAPEHRPAVVGLVAAAVQSGRLAEAQEFLERYLNIKPADVEARFHFAAILFGEKNMPRAEEELEKVLSAKPDHHGALQLKDHLKAS